MFDPQSGSKYSKDDDHIAQIMELVGEFPKSIAFSGKYSSEFFNRKGEQSPVMHLLSLTDPLSLLGELRHIHRLRFWPIELVLHDKYLLPKGDADLIGSFLTPMLRLHPEKRAKASELIHHAWLDGIVVQGEIDQIRAAEASDSSRAAVGGGNTPQVVAAQPSASSAQPPGRLADTADALKPIEDSPPASLPSSSVVTTPAPIAAQPTVPRRQSKSHSKSKSKSQSHPPAPAPIPGSATTYAATDHNAQRLVSIT